MSMAGWIILGVVVLLLLYVMGIYNRLVRLRALVKEGFSGITVQLRRRADLIPNLVETVQGYATHEREVFEEVTKARAASVNAGGVAATAQADAQMTGMLGRLFAVAEAYPELKANTNFLQLQDQLASIEGELQSARRYYNATVRDLNSTIQSFPPVLIARPMGFTEEPFYQDDDPAIQSAPKVSLRQAGGLTMRRAWRALAALLLLLVPAAAQADERILRFCQRRPGPEGFARSTSPRRSTSTPRTTGSITASSATSRPAIAGRTAAGSASASPSRAQPSTECRCPPSTASRSPMASASRSAIPTRSSRPGEHSFVLHYRTTRADRPLQGL